MSYIENLNQLLKTRRKSKIISTVAIVAFAMVLSAVFVSIPPQHLSTSDIRAAILGSCTPTTDNSDPNPPMVVEYYSYVFNFSDGSTASGTQDRALDGHNLAVNVDGVDMIIHGSCSDDFPDGYGEKGDPTLADGHPSLDTYHIWLYKADGTLDKECGDVLPATTTDLLMTNTDGVPEATPGGTLTYTMEAGNAGPGDAIGATVTNDFPDSLTGVTWTCSATAGSTCPASGTGDINHTVDLLECGVATYTVSVDVSPSATISITDTATVAVPAGMTDTDPSNNSATDVDTIPQSADLAMTNTDGVTVAIPGGTLTYILTATNNGPNDAIGATVVDDFPDSLTGVTWTCSATAGSSCPASGTGDISHPVILLTGGVATYTVDVDVSPTATGTIVTTATVAPPVGLTDPDLSNNSATDTDTVTDETQVEVSKDDDALTSIPGTPIVYEIIFLNNGPTDLVDATLTDFLPPELIDATWTCVASAGSSCIASGTGDIVDTTVDLLVAGTATYTLSATIVSTAVGELTNLVTVTNPLTGGTSTDTDINTLTPVADLSVTKTDESSAIKPGEPITYTMTATNDGPSSVTQALLTDVFPPELIGATWTCVAPADSACSASGTGDISDLVDIKVGSTLVYTVTATVDPLVGDILENTVEIAPPVDVTDPDLTNNIATDINSTASVDADLQIVKTDSPDPLAVGTLLVYTLNVKNNGPATAVDTIVIDTLPAGVSYNSVTTTTGTCSGTSVITCLLGNLDDQDEATITITVATLTEGVISNTSTVSSSTNDPIMANNTSTATTTVTGGGGCVVNCGGGGGGGGGGGERTPDPVPPKVVPPCLLFEPDRPLELIDLQTAPLAYRDYVETIKDTRINFDAIDPLKEGVELTEFTDLNGFFVVSGYAVPDDPTPTTAVLGPNNPTLRFELTKVLLLSHCYPILNATTLTEKNNGGELAAWKDMPRLHVGNDQLDYVTDVSYSGNYWGVWDGYLNAQGIPDTIGAFGEVQTAEAVKMFIRLGELNNNEQLTQNANTGNWWDNFYVKARLLKVGGQLVQDYRAELVVNRAEGLYELVKAMVIRKKYVREEYNEVINYLGITFDKSNFPIFRR
jgi:uncharacterized repeat protein (TIGR01451 family)